MSVTPTRLYHGKPAAAGEDVYTAPAGGMVVLNIVATNTTGALTTFTLELNPTGAPPAQYLMNAKAILANDVYTLRLFLPLAAGDVIRATNPAGTPVALLLTGVTPS